MKQLLILSGKGGTGKTTVASAFIQLAHAKAYADCDVDAPNLHLVTSFRAQEQKSDFYGMSKAEIDPELCVNCGKCAENCRFDAILKDDSYHVDGYACEGCGVCEAICPAKAITLKPAVAGELMKYKTADTVFSTAKLKMGSGNTGFLVTEVKKQMREAAPTDAQIAIVDGSPGIGCPVIASLSGVDMVLIVTEPSLSGISDLKRIIKTVEVFQTKAAVCINKYDINQENAQEIETFCQENNLPLVGKIPFDSDVVKFVNQGKNVMASESAAAHAIADVFARTSSLLMQEK